MHKSVTWLPQIGSESVEVLFLLAVPGAQYFTATTVSHGEEQRCTSGQRDLFPLLTLRVSEPGASHFGARLADGSSIAPTVRQLARVLSVFGLSHPSYCTSITVFLDMLCIWRRCPERPEVAKMHTFFGNSRRSKLYLCSTFQEHKSHKGTQRK